MNKTTQEIINHVNRGIQTAYIDSGYDSNKMYRPEFISNDYKKGKKVISALEAELSTCDEFAISVAFITMSGITPLLQILKELELRNVPGKILTTDYLMFSEPAALEKLSELKNIEIKMFRTDVLTGGFHTKGYIFRKDEVYRMIIGSSNLTLSAITKNREWNTKIVSTQNGALANDILEEFNSIWNDRHSIDYEKYKTEYQDKYNQLLNQRKVLKKQKVVTIESFQFTPNKMQCKFIKSLKKLRKEGAQKALLLSATGTGKTYASAFAVRDEMPNKILFLVHREQIAKQAVKSYKQVFGNTKQIGLLSGNSKELSAEYLFSTMQMMAKPEIHTKFNPSEFDTIIVDEVHRVGAESYQRIMSYFKPNFWLGMTASPERTDGFDIYKLFDHNIAYEIRLQQALEEELLCPFHYFGITDLEINGEVFDDNTGVRNFNKLVSDDRVDYIIEKVLYYGHCGERVKGLIFCSRKNEAEALSRKFNERGFNTNFLCGDDSQERREEAIARLEQDELENSLDYIFTVDIFNEGVDIPSINQVIMLRPTESPVIFIQQLGRGLRKAQSKEYVVILDFIGNYMNNFMIPIALSGDRSYNKDSIRKYVREGSQIIPGSSTIHFDEISKKRIFDSIDNSTTNKKFLRDKYFVLKNKLGKIPSILDFYEYGEIDPMLFISYAKTYDNFIRMIDKDYTVTFSGEEEAMLEFVSSLLVNGKRPHELLLLQLLLNKKEFKNYDFQVALKNINDIYREEDYTSALRVLKKDFLNTLSEKNKYRVIDFLEQVDVNNQRFNRSLFLYNRLKKNNFYNELENLIQYGLKIFQDKYKGHDEDNLVLYEKYSRKDVCRILNWEKDDSSTIYGYRIKYGTCPIFVTYEKKDDIAKSTKYEDQFLNNQIFSWMTRSKVTLNSTETKEIVNFKETGLKIYLFIKKSDGEGSDFYYMGKVEPIHWEETIIINNDDKELPIMNFQLKLEHEVRNDIFEYFTK